jgi:hypothetical protein
MSAATCSAEQRLMRAESENGRYVARPSNIAYRLADPAGQAARIVRFVGGRLDVESMATVAEPALYRNRGG